MRISGIHVLSQLQGNEEIHSTADLLLDPDPDVRHVAMTALGESTAPLATSRLLDAFEKGDEFMRSTVAYYLAESGHPRAFDLLIEAALSSRSDGGHFYDAIESVNSPEAQEALARLKQLVPPDHEELKGAILNTKLMQEEYNNAFSFYRFDDAMARE